MSACLNVFGPIYNLVETPELVGGQVGELLRLGGWAEVAFLPHPAADVPPVVVSKSRLPHQPGDPGHEPRPRRFRLSLLRSAIERVFRCLGYHLCLRSPSNFVFAPLCEIVREVHPLAILRHVPRPLPPPFDRRLDQDLPVARLVAKPHAPGGGILLGGVGVLRGPPRRWSPRPGTPTPLIPQLFAKTH